MDKKEILRRLRDIYDGRNWNEMLEFLGLLEEQVWWDEVKPAGAE